jgi:ectoine hydroxylase-related dioxygenase (phytanoyl-CoA dioxygenase family)
MEHIMNGEKFAATRRNDDRYRERDCSVAAFAASIEAGRRTLSPQWASALREQVPIYDCTVLRGRWDDAAARAELFAEWIEVLQHGAGVFVLQRAFDDTDPVDDATAVFEAIVRDERQSGISGADHFAKAGANDRVWNALEKLCIRAPAVFARYYANPFIAAASHAWLGPQYQMTSQINVVRPGGAAQQAHRDYHLGFQTAHQAERYPPHVHTMSPFLTLQGAVAHCDMPVESGPTKLLPYSQRYAPGYVAWHRQDFRDYFEAHCVQLPLAKGDVVFFNPALFHAAGSNRTADVARMANLLQVSSAYGRAMESVNRLKMCEALYPVLLEYRSQVGVTAAQVDAVIASCAEGYSFPTNLDMDPPLDGLAPASQQDLLWRALDEVWPAARVINALRDQARRRAA